jgi:hypothetical protein
MKRATLFVTLLLMVAALALGVRWAFNPGSASSSSSLACTVTDTACGGDEVEVFRMSNTSNAHAGEAASTYTYRVCCGSVAALGLGTNCSGVYDTVLRLSASDNAHVQSTGSYPTEVCLSTTVEETVECTYSGTCGGDYACLATISGSTNAHVADCDGTDDYGTKVCCYAGPAAAPVGGLAELPDASDSSGRNYVAFAGLAAAALVALTASSWYVRRRLLR